MTLVSLFQLALGLVLLVDPAVSQVATVKSRVLNLRASPSTDAEILGRFSRGERVSVLEERGDWLFVTASGVVSGWFHRDLVTIEEGRAAGLAAARVGRPAAQSAAAVGARGARALVRPAGGGGSSAEAGGSERSTIDGVVAWTVMTEGMLSLREACDGTSRFEGSAQSRLVSAALQLQCAGLDLEEAKQELRADPSNQTWARILEARANRWGSVRSDLDRALEAYGRQQGDMVAGVRLLRSMGLLN